MQAEQSHEVQLGTFVYSVRPIPAIKEVAEQMRSSPENPLELVSDYSRFKAAVRQISHACIIYDLKDGDDLKNLAEFAHLIRSEVDSGVIQLLVLCQLQHPKIGAFLSKLNCSRILYPPFTAKGLKIAIGRHAAIAQKSVAESHEDEGIASITDLGSARKTVTSRAVKECEPVNTPDDCWLGKASAVRSIHGKWLCIMMGPGPVTGTWKELKRDATVNRLNDDRLWEWQPSDPANDLFVKEGTWRFSGRLPEFRQNSWTFIGVQPSLVYVKNGEVLEKRFFCDSAEAFTLAKNSMAGLRKLADIRASIDFEVYLKHAGAKTSFAEYVDKKKQARELSAELEGEDALEEGFDFEKEVQRPPLEAKKAAEEAARELEVTQKNEKQRAADPFSRSNSQAAAKDPEKSGAAARTPAFGGGVFGNKKVEPKKLEIFQKADSLLASTSKLFKLVESEIGRSARFKETSRGLSPATVWTTKRALREPTVVLSEGKKRDSIRVAYPGYWTRDQMLGELDSLRADRVYFNVNTRRTSLFFVHPLSRIQFDEAAMEVLAPESMYEVQRRDHFRFQFRPPMSLKVSAGLETNFKYPLVWDAKDISAGGVALAFAFDTKTDEPIMSRLRKIKTGDVLPNIQFEIYGNSIRAAAQVRWIKEKGEPGDTLREVIMGLQYISISPEDREGIRFFVMEESFDYLESVLDAELLL